MATTVEVLRKWECGVTPQVEAFPNILAFLGNEPWPEPKTLPRQLKAERRRRGITIEHAAVLLVVDASTWWWADPPVLSQDVLFRPSEVLNRTASVLTLAGGDVGRRA